MGKQNQDQGRLRVGAVAVGLGILASRLIGFVRERVFAHFLGNSDLAGVFRAALGIPNLLQNLFGEGALSASFIPVYAKLVAEGRQLEARRVATAVLLRLASAMLLLTTVGVYFAEPLTDTLVAGFAPALRELTIGMVRVMLPGVALLVLSAWCLGILNSHKKFFLSYAAPVLWSGAIIAMLCWHGSEIDAVSLATSTVIGAALQFAIQLPLALRCMGGLALGSSASEALRKVLTGFVPALFSRGVVQISAYFDRWLASFFGASAVAAIGYAQTIYTLPVSLFGMSISAAELPTMSGLKGDEHAVHTAIRQRQTAGLRKISFFVSPSIIAFLLLGDLVVSAIFQTGAFRAADVRGVWLILAASSLALLANTQGRLLYSGFWALGDTRTPLMFACLRVLLSASLGATCTFLLRPYLQLDAMQSAALLSLVSSLVAWCEFHLARRALAGRLGSFSLERKTTVLLLAIALSAALVVRALHSLLPPFPWPWLWGGGLLAIYGALYLVASWRLGLDQTGLMRRLAQFCRRRIDAR